jgi:hypothetical protein
MKSQILNTDDLKDFDDYFPSNKIESINPFKNCKYVRYQGGFDPETHEGLSVEQILELESVKWFSNRDGFYGFFTTGHGEGEFPLKLMALYDWNDEFNGCMRWNVVGFLHGYIQAFTKLKIYNAFRADHKPTCWIRKYDSCRDLINVVDFPEKAMKIAKELGWQRDDFMGIANHCDCGYNEIRK